MNFEAKLAAPAAVTWLNSTKEARILGLFDRSCTLINDDGELLSLVTSDIGPGPFALVIVSAKGEHVSDGHLFSGIRFDQPITVRNGCIFLDSLIINSRMAEMWDPQPDWLAMTVDIFLEKLLLIKQLLKLHGPPGSLADLISGSELNQTQQLIGKVWPYLAEGLGELDLGKNRDQVSQLAGLGGGLTPAGDDFLLGVIIALYSFIPLAGAKRVALEIVNAAVGRTTRLSMSWLEAAARGEVTQYWQEFIEALVAGGHENCRRAGLLIIGTGHTSGADALTGFIMAGERLSMISTAER